MEIFNRVPQSVLSQNADKYSEQMRSGAYLRVRNFLLFLIGNGDFQQSSSVCTVAAKSDRNSEAMRWGAYLLVQNFLLILIGNGDFSRKFSTAIHN